MILRPFILLMLCISVQARCEIIPKESKFREVSGNSSVFLNNVCDTLFYKGGSQEAGGIPSSMYHLRNEQASFKTKALRGSLLVLGVEAFSTTVLFLTPVEISKWNRSEVSVENCLKNFKRAYTEPPVMDKDIWVVNYVGHPYQGAYFYNAVRSQNASILQSSLFCLGHSMAWEYFTEAFMEQPSIQDLIVTPLTGIILGELAHKATIRMSRNGFTWFEKSITFLINPMYVFNNGFRKR